MNVPEFKLHPEVVRARFREAVRQGQPRWLWPETTPQNWQAALGQIELAVRHVLAGDRAAARLAGDPDDIGVAAFTSGTGPLLGHWAKEGRLDAERSVLSLLEAHLAHNAERMERLARFAISAVEALANADLRVTVLKGMHTAHSYFPVPGSRPVSDIDLLIEASEVEAANETLRSLGYLPGHTGFGEQAWRLAGTSAEPCSLSLVHRDGPWYIDLHTSLDRRFSAGAPLIRMDRALQYDARGRWAPAPSGEVLAGAGLVLYLASHASRGLAALSMVRLIELVFVIRRFEQEDRLLWDDFLALSARTGNLSCSYPALHQANILAPGLVPESIFEKLKQDVPRAVRLVVEPLTPATCQRVLRNSFRERFMWTRSIGGWAREIVGSLLPRVGLKELIWIYRMRCWILVRRTFAR